MLSQPGYLPVPLPNQDLIKTSTGGYNNVAQYDAEKEGEEIVSCPLEN
jgi:hypothetical protein